MTILDNPFFNTPEFCIFFMVAIIVIILATFFVFLRNNYDKISDSKYDYKGVPASLF